MEIRSFVERDRDAVIALWKDCGLIAPQNDPNKDIDRKLAVNPELFLVGTIDNDLISTVMGGYEGHRGWINYLAVRPSHQRIGQGQKIVQTVEELIKAKGCPKINLQVRIGNQSAINFYKAVGYVDDPVVSLGKRLEIE